jgi:hypothetical protein
MKLGLYTFAALTLIALVGAFVYTLELGSYRLDLLNITLPITLWIVLPALLLFIFTVGHMIFYGMRNYFQIKKWKKDTVSLEDALYWSLLNEPKDKKYVMSEVKSSALLLSKSSLSVSDNIEGLSPRLAKVVNVIQKIKNGEYVDLKEEKMTKVFNDGNPILIKNRLNCLESDDKFVEDVMKSSSSYSEAVQAEALEIFARKTDFDKARKYTKIFDVPNFLVLLNRVTAEDDLLLSKDILSNFVQDLKLSCADFIKIAEVTKKYFKPDENLALFNTYQKENNKAQNAYLYLLFEYELLEQVKVYLDEQEENEFVKFRALSELKQQNAKYKLEEIIDIYSVCNETKFL